jgi:hypothetical protein
MNLKKINFGFLIVVIQILLLVSMIPAESYIINQIDSSNNNVPIIQNNPKSLIDSVPELTGLLISLFSIQKNFYIFLDFSVQKTKTILSILFSIKQIGIVSAQGSCCRETNNGAICQDTGSGSSSSDPESCESPLPTSCEGTSVCKLGTCIYDEGLSCAANSPKEECEERKGIWNNKLINEIPECDKGACVLASDLEYATEKQCDILSQSRGLEMDFRPGMDEFDFSEISDNLPKGACSLGNGNCRFVTAMECDNMAGDFQKNFLCSNPHLETNCVPTQETTCIKDKVYFVDSCGNPANIYDSSKVDAEANPDYWAKVNEFTCNIDLNNPDSAKSCGNCNLFLSSQCDKASGENPDYGNYICKDLRCTDEKGNKRKVGDKWCVYDSYIGDGKDTVGSEHWLAYCNNNAELEVDMCGGTRGQICEQSVAEINGETFSTAACVTNKGLACIKGDVSCSDPHCILKKINVDTGFKFDVCSSRYPRGFDLRNPSESNSNDLCSIANNECLVVYKKCPKSGWKCVKNCNCETIEFSRQLNDLCVSLGDCGSYTNYKGACTDNIQVENAPAVSCSEYQGYANAGGQPPGLPQGQSSSGSSSGSGGGGSGGSGSNQEDIETVTGIAQFVGGQALDLALGRGYISKIAKIFSSPLVPGTKTTYVTPDGMWGFDPPPEIPFLDKLSGGIEDIITDFFNPGNLVAFGLNQAIGIGLGKIFNFGEGPAEQFASTIASGVAKYAIFSAIDAMGIEGLPTLVGENFVRDLVFGSMISLGISLAISALMGGLGFGGCKTKIVRVKFTCLPWQAPSGGESCELCNEDPLKPCTEYRCESMGQGCNLINKNTNNPLCTSKSEELTPAVISSGKVMTQGHEFQNQENEKIEIRRNNGGCIQEFTPVLFTLETSKPAQCKWDFNSTKDFESMARYLAEGTQYTSDHTFAVEGLGSGILQANNVSEDMIEELTGDMNMYIRCKDSFGNINLNAYTVNFCINSGRDVTPVSHSSTITLPKNQEVLSYGTNKVDLKMWVNEPAECKYSDTEGKSYDEMANSMTCKTDLTDREMFGWPCSTELTNIKNEDTFYIKCKDQPLETSENERNINVEDFVYKVYVTENNLDIDSISILHDNVETDLNQDTFTEIKGGGNIFSIELGVETSEGTKNGVSLCSYQWNNDWIYFLDTNSYYHKQKFNLANGNYNVGIKCEDDKGNKIIKNAKFVLDVDHNAPIVVRTYQQSRKLNVITNEQAKCYFSFDSLRQCNFNIEDKEDMETGFKTSHSTDWINGKTYYIKCEDAWENQNPGCAVKVTTS